MELLDRPYLGTLKHGVEACRLNKWGFSGEEPCGGTYQQKSWVEAGEAIFNPSLANPIALQPLQN